MEEGSHHDGAFIVRIWWEHGESLTEPRRWRGWAQHVRNGKQVYFQALAPLLSFIAEETGAGAERELPLDGIG